MFEIQLHNDHMGESIQQTISGRDIHAALEISKDYTSWVKDQIESLHLIENIDYIIFTARGENSGRGRPRSEYHFTTEIAKHIALASRTEKGRAYRQALIDLEKSVSLIASGDRPTAQAVGIAEDYIKLAELFGTPKHIGLIEATKAIKLLGIDVTPLLQSSPHVDNIQAEDIYLEPTDLGKRHNMTGAEMNKLLAQMQLQAKMHGQWEPTDSGRGLCIKHSWKSTTSSKSGYNLKWNVHKVEQLIDEYTEQSNRAMYE